MSKKLPWSLLRKHFVVYLLHVDTKYTKSIVVANTNAVLDLLKSIRQCRNVIIHVCRVYLLQRGSYNIQPLVSPWLCLTLLRRFVCLCWTVQRFGLHCWTACWERMRSRCLAKGRLKRPNSVFGLESIVFWFTTAHRAELHLTNGRKVVLNAIYWKHFQ